MKTAPATCGEHRPGFFTSWSEMTRFHEMRPRSPRIPRESHVRGFCGNGGIGQSPQNGLKGMALRIASSSSRFSVYSLPQADEEILPNRRRSRDRSPDGAARGRGLGVRLGNAGQRTLRTALSHGPESHEQGLPGAAACVAHRLSAGRLPIRMAASSCAVRTSRQAKGGRRALVPGASKRRTNPVKSFWCTSA